MSLALAGTACALHFVAKAAAATSTHFPEMCTLVSPFSDVKIRRTCKPSAIQAIEDTVAKRVRLVLHIRSHNVGVEEEVALATLCASTAFWGCAIEEAAFRVTVFHRELSVMPSLVALAVIAVYFNGAGLTAFQRPALAIEWSVLPILASMLNPHQRDHCPYRHRAHYSSMRCPYCLRLLTDNVSNQTSQVLCGTRGVQFRTRR